MQQGQQRLASVETCLTCRSLQGFLRQVMFSMHDLQVFARVPAAASSKQVRQELPVVHKDTDRALQSSMVVILLPLLVRFCCPADCMRLLVEGHVHEG